MTAVAVAGAGHVGLVYAAGLASFGHVVRVVDVDASRVRRLRRGDVPFHEPGLDRLVRRGVAKGRLSFTTSYRAALAGADLVFVCVPTPSRPDGRLDDTALSAAFGSIRLAAGRRRPIVVNKSTVPVGTADSLAILRDAGFEVVSAPEFLAQGAALQGFRRPDRIVLGAARREPAVRVAALFKRTGAPVIITDNASAEFSKLAANAFLATKISYANSVSHVAAELGLDTDAVLQIVGMDRRIGRAHLGPGMGFGGSCLPKDVAAMRQLAREHGIRSDIFDAAIRVNEEATEQIVRLLERHGVAPGDRRIGVLGIAYKAGTDDTRDSRALALMSRLRALGAAVRAYDPVARLPRGAAPGVAQARSALEAADGAAALIVATDWPEFARLPAATLARRMAGDLVIDARGVMDRERLARAGLRVVLAAAAGELSPRERRGGRATPRASARQSPGTHSSPRRPRGAPRAPGRPAR